MTQVQAKGDEWMDVIPDLRRAVCREFGMPEARHAEFADAAKRPALRDVCVYVRENKAGPCALKAGDALPELPLVHVDPLGSVQSMPGTDALCAPEPPCTLKSLCSADARPVLLMAGSLS
jgi:hypothetical protein